MTAFATPTDFASRLGVNLTDAEISDVETLLDLATGLIQGETGQTISRVTDDELTIRSVYGNRIVLPERPVVAVNGVQLGSSAVTDWYLDGSDIVRGRIYAANGPDNVSGWWGPTYLVTITYTHGFDPIPDSIKAICLEMVVRAWVNPGVVLAETHGSEQVTYQRSNGLLLTEDERRVLMQIIGGDVGTVMLR